jgi:ubiquinol-cytochrome c reductase cytochrome b subunit
MGFLKRAIRWLDDRLGISSTILPIVEHPVPQTGWDYVLGSATLVAFVVQVITGVALAFSYVPTPDHAYESLQFITHDAILGGVVRGIHYWGATAMVVLVVAHMAQVFLIGAYKFPRELNWLSGTFLLLLTLGLAFTGQLLRWNQDAYWAVVVGAAQAARAPFIGEWLAQVLVAGQTVGGATLTRFYATHVFLLPAGVFVLVGVHLYLALRHGISEPPRPGQPVEPSTYRKRYADLVHKEGVPFWPDAAWKDVVFALAVGTIVLLLAVVVGPPELGRPADPTIVEAYPRPDWYFLWYFALLALLPAGIEDWFIIGFPLLVGVLLFILPLIAPTGERSPWRRPWAMGTVGFSAIAIGVLVWAGFVAPWSPVFQPAPLPGSVTGRLSGDERRGAEIFQSRGCVNCHVVAGTGGQRGPDLTTVGDRLSRDQLTSRILIGGLNMPAYGGTLQPDELDALVAFLSAQRRQLVERGR